MMLNKEEIYSNADCWTTKALVDPTSISSPSIFSFIKAPETLTITMNLKGGQVSFGPDEVKWTGFKNADEASIEILNALAKNFPIWKETIIKDNK